MASFNSFVYRRHFWGHRMGFSGTSEIWSLELESGFVWEEGTTLKTDMVLWFLVQLKLQVLGKVHFWRDWCLGRVETTQQPRVDCTCLAAFLVKSNPQVMAERWVTGFQGDQPGPGPTFFFRGCWWYLGACMTLSSSTTSKIFEVFPRNVKKTVCPVGVVW